MDSSRRTRAKKRRCNSLSFIASSNAFVHRRKHRAVRSCASSNRRLNPAIRATGQSPHFRARPRSKGDTVARHTSRGRQHLRARAMLRASSRRRARVFASTASSSKKSAAWARPQIGAAAAENFWRNHSHSAGPASGAGLGTSDRYNRFLCHLLRYGIQAPPIMPSFCSKV